MKNTMKLASATVLSLLMASAASAGIFGLPPHEQDGYRDTGCDPAQQVQILNDEGDYLYSNNPTCPDVGGAGIATDNKLFNPPAAEEEPEEICTAKVCS